MLLPCRGVLLQIFLYFTWAKYTKFFCDLLGFFGFFCRKTGCGVSLSDYFPRFWLGQPCGHVRAQEWLRPSPASPRPSIRKPTGGMHAHCRGHRDYRTWIYEQTIRAEFRKIQPRRLPPRTELCCLLRHQPKFSRPQRRLIRSR